MFFRSTIAARTAFCHTPESSETRSEEAERVAVGMDVKRNRRKSNPQMSTGYSIFAKDSKNSSLRAVFSSLDVYIGTEELIVSRKTLPGGTIECGLEYPY